MIKTSTHTQSKQPWLHSQHSTWRWRIWHNGCFLQVNTFYGFSTVLHWL